MEIRISTLEEIDERSWNKRVASDANATTRQTTIDARRTKDYIRAKPYFLQAFEGTEVVAQLVFYKCFIYWAPLLVNPLLFKAVLPLLQWHFQMYFWYFGPLVFEQDRRALILSEILRAIEEQAHRDKVMSINAIPCIAMKDHPLQETVERAFEEWAYEKEDVGTISLALDKTEDELWGDLDSRLRRKVNRARRDGVEVEEVHKREELAEYACLLKETYQRNGLVERPNRWLDLFFDHYRGTDYVRLYLARLNGRPLAGQLIEQLNGNAYLAGVSVADEALQNSIPANELLQWEIIRRCRQEEMQFIDWGGYVLKPQNAKDEGINKFKKKWGGEVYAYHRYSKILRHGQFKLIQKLRDRVVARR